MWLPVISPTTPEWLEWFRALYNASMILTGMGPVGTLTTDAAKIFASLYALFSGLLFISLIAITVTGSRNVGIGTTNPTSMLHVTGDVRVDGNISAKYQDLAEWVPARPGLVNGTVLVVDRDKVNHVLPAATPYDTGVAGVVSAQPGIVLGEPGNDKVMVTHNGRVRVKVDAQYGAIAVGDLLLTSPTPGHAMRSIPVNLGGVEIHRPGTILGKALESIENGQGEILVLLTLQ